MVRDGHKDKNWIMRDKHIISATATKLAPPPEGARSVANPSPVSSSEPTRLSSRVSSQNGWAPDGLAPKEIEQPLSAFLKQQRTLAGLTQEALAERAGVSVRTIRGLEQRIARRRLPHADTLTRIIIALRVSPQEAEALRRTVYGASSEPTLIRSPMSSTPVSEGVQRGRHEEARGRLEAPTESSIDQQIGTLDPPLALPLTSPLIGRDDLIQAALTLLGEETTRLLTLVGPPGVGKTRIGLEIARCVTKSHLSGDAIARRVVYVALAALTHPSLLLSAIAQTLNLCETNEQPLLHLVVTALRGRPTLLILDNFEHVLAATSEVLALLGACPEVKALVTSRAALRVGAERELPIPPLAAPAPMADIMTPLDATQLAGLAQSPSVALFLQRARASAPSLSLDPRTGPVIAAICRAVDGLPLAIELAAARCRLFSPTALLSRFGQRLLILGDVAPDRPQRHQTMRAAIDWSYQLLTTREQRIFRRLAIFADGCSLEAAEAICEEADDQSDIVEEEGRRGSGNSGGECSFINDLTTLVAHSLVVRVDGTDGMPRILLLETVREYALEQLEALREYSDTAQWHCAYFGSFLSMLRAEQQSARASFDSRPVDHEYANIRAALVWAIDHQDISAAIRLVAGLWRYWYSKGMLTEGRRWMEATLGLVGGHAHEHEYCQNGLGRLPATQLALGAPTDTPPLIGRQCGAEQDDERVSHSVEVNDAALGEALNGFGMLLYRQGALALARVWLERSLAVRRNSGDQQAVAATLNNLGLVAADEGLYAEAQRLHEASLELKRTLSLADEIAVSLSNLGAVLRAQGNYQDARTCLEENLAMQRAFGAGYRLTHALGNLGTLAYSEGKYERALRYYQECLAMQQEQGDTHGSALTLHNLAEVAAAQGDVNRALAHAEESLGVFRALNERMRILSGLTLMGTLRSRQGALAAAAESFRGALALYRELGVRRTGHHWLMAIADLAARAGLFERATQLFIACEAQRCALGVAWTAYEQTQWDWLSAQLAESVGAQVVEAISHDATGWSWDTALTQAEMALDDVREGVARRANLMG